MGSAGFQPAPVGILPTGTAKPRFVFEADVRREWDRPFDRAD